jgi:putative transposase
VEEYGGGYSFGEINNIFQVCEYFNYICNVILTLKIKLLPSKEQETMLLNTIKEANAAANAISDRCWDAKCFRQFDIHKQSYHAIKDSFNLSAQMIVRTISKVADAYKIDKKTKRVFNELGAISYDSRILTYKPNNNISIWCLGGRQLMPYVCHNAKYIPFIKGEADLIFRKGKFFLFQSVNIPDEAIEDVEEFIGVDLGLTDIAVTSDGVVHSANWANEYREQKQKVRSSIQSKGTKGAKKLLKRLSGRERITATIINHTISKSIVKSAKEQNKGVSIEDLTNIRFTSKRRNRKFKSKLGKWSFFQLRQFLTYKCTISGVRLVVVKPNYTSKTCNNCFRIGIRNNKSFKCNNCGNNTDADINAAKNIATLGASINAPEQSTMYCSLHD